jgi:predicted transcriptional regulator
MVDKVAKGARISGADRERLTNTLRKQYEKGASLRELAEQTGRSYGFVHRMLTDAGVTLRGRGGSTRTKKN